MLAASPYAWQADLDTTLVVPVLALAYLFLAGRYGTTRDRAVAFGGALVLLALAFWTPIHHLGLHYLLTAHLLQNVILAEWAPLLAGATMVGEEAVVFFAVFAYWLRRFFREEGA